MLKKHANLLKPLFILLFKKNKKNSSEVTDLAARELVVLLHGVWSPLPLLVPGLCPLLCPLLSLWEGMGEVKAVGVWLSGSVLTNPERGRR